MHTAPEIKQEHDSYTLVMIEENYVTPFVKNFSSNTHVSHFLSFFMKSITLSLFVILAFWST